MLQDPLPLPPGDGGCPSRRAPLGTSHGAKVALPEGESDDPKVGDLDPLFADGRVDDAVDSVKLIDDPYLLVARPGDFPRGPVALADLDDQAMVAWPATCDQPRLEEVLRREAEIRTVFRSASNEVLLSGPSTATRALARDLPAQTRSRTQSPLALETSQIARQVAEDLSTQIKRSARTRSRGG